MRTVVRRYFPNPAPLIGAGFIVAVCAIAATFLWSIAPSGAGVAIGMGLAAIGVLILSPNKRYLTAARLRIPQRYGNMVSRAQMSANYARHPRATTFYFIMSFRGMESYGQRRNSAPYFWYDEAEDSFIRAASFLEERFPKARYIELAELTERLEGYLGRDAEAGRLLGGMLRAWHASGATADQAVELASRYGFEVAAVMVEHDLTHEYAAAMVEN